VADLRRDGRLRRVPLVVYTGAEVSSKERDDLRLGSTVFLTKGRTAPDAVLRSVLDLLDVAAGRDVGHPDQPDRTDHEDQPEPQEQLDQPDRPDQPGQPGLPGPHPTTRPR
jgi:hypothetical protein